MKNIKTKKNIFVISLLAVAVLMVQCRKPGFDFENATDDSELQEITFSANSDGGKGSFNGALKYVWATGDKIHVYASTTGTFGENNSKYCGVLNLESGASQTSANFYSSGINIPVGATKLLFVHYGSEYNSTTNSSTFEGAVTADFSKQSGNMADISNKVVAMYESDVKASGRYSGTMEIQFAVVWINLSNLVTDGASFKMLNVYYNGLQVDKYGKINKVRGNIVNLQSSNLSSYYLIVVGETEKTYHTFYNTNTKGCADLPYTFLQNKFYCNNTITPNTAYNITTILPEGALPGVVKISSEEKAHFSRGNLFWNPVGDKWKMEDNQWDIRDTYASGQCVGNFYWTLHCFGTQETYKAEGNPDVLNWDEFYCDKNGIPIGDWMLFTHELWNYVKSNNDCAIVEFDNGTNTNTALVILPYGSTETASSITNVSKLNSSYAALLPACATRDKTSFLNVTSGYYWSRNRIPEITDKAYSFNFDKGGSGGYINQWERSYGCGVRLVSKKY